MKKSNDKTLVRKCDTCKMVTAIDVDNTPKYKRDMQMPGQTVYEIDPKEAAELWKTAGACQCKK